MRNIPLLTLIFLSVLGCNSNSKEDQNVVENYYSNGSLKSRAIIINGIKQGTEINFYSQGTVKSILNYKNNKLDGEQCYFYTNGYLEQKEVRKDGIGNGTMFSFYSNGTVQAFRFYSDGKEILYGVDYWSDSIPMTKSSLHFNDSGQLYYKKNFDKKGNFLSEEGKTNKESFYRLCWCSSPAKF